MEILTTPMEPDALEGASRHGLTTVMLLHVTLHSRLLCNWAALSGVCYGDVLPQDAVPTKAMAMADPVMARKTTDRFHV